LPTKQDLASAVCHLLFQPVKVQLADDVSHLVAGAFSELFLDGDDQTINELVIDTLVDESIVWRDAGLA